MYIHITEVAKYVNNQAKTYGKQAKIRTFLGPNFTCKNPLTMHTQIVIRLSTLTIIQERKKMIYVTPRARNQIEIEIVLHQKRMGGMKL